MSKRKNLYDYCSGGTIKRQQGGHIAYNGVDVNPNAPRTGAQQQKIAAGMGTAASAVSKIPGIGTAAGAVLGLGSVILGAAGRKAARKYNEWATRTNNMEMMSNNNTVAGGNFRKGGDIGISDNDIKIQGNANEIDGERRNVVGQPVALSHDELVEILGPQEAHAFSSDKKMPHPLGDGQTFAEMMEPIKRGMGKAQDKMSRFGLKENSPEGKTAEWGERVASVNRQRQTEIRESSNGKTPMTALQSGGYVGDNTPFTTNNEAWLSDQSFNPAMQQSFNQNIQAVGNLQSTSTTAGQLQPLNLTPQQQNDPSLSDPTAYHLNLINQARNQTSLLDPIETKQVEVRAMNAKDMESRDSFVGPKTSEWEWLNNLDFGSPKSASSDNINTPAPGQTFEGRQMQLNTQGTGDGGKFKFNDVMVEGSDSGLSSTEADMPTDDTLKNTKGDWAIAGSHLLGTLAKGINLANNQPEYVRPLVDRTPISRPRVSSEGLLNRNRRLYNAAIKQTKSGSANVDRTLKQGAFAEKYARDLDVLNQTANTNAQLDFQYSDSRKQQNQFNLGMMSDAREKTAMEKGNFYSETDKVISSGVASGETIGNMSNTRAMNNLKLKTLNELSQRYKISVDDLIKIMESKEAGNLITYKQQYG